MSDELTFQQMYEEYEKTSALTVLPAGTYELKVTGCTVRKGASGKDGLQPVYTLTQGPDAGARVMAGGIYPGSTADGLAAFMRKLEAFGLTKDFLKTPGLEMKDVASALVGRVVSADLGVEEWNGEPRNTMGFKIKLVGDTPPLPSVGGVPQIPGASAPPVVAPPNQATAATSIGAPPVNETFAGGATAAPAIDDDPGF